MKHFNVLLDTNIFMAAKYNFAGGSLLNLKKYCENGTATLFTNDIILREVQSHIDDDVGLMARQAKNAIRQHGELVNAITRQAYETIEATIWVHRKPSVLNLRPICQEQRFYRTKDYRLRFCLITISENALCLKVIKRRSGSFLMLRSL